MNFWKISNNPDFQVGGNPASTFYALAQSLSNELQMAALKRKNVMTEVPDLKIGVIESYKTFLFLF